MLRFGGQAAYRQAELRRGVLSAAGRGAARIVLALEDRSLLSADILEALRRTSADLAAEGRSLVVVCPDPRLRRLLVRTGLSCDYELVPSLDVAA